MPAQSYTMRRFEVPSSLVGKGNYLANKLTQFFSLNPTVSVVTLSCNWREGRSRADTLYFNMCFRGGGSPGRMWASQFSANATQTCEDLAQIFFDANPSYIPVQTVLLSRPDTMPRNRKLLVIYATGSNVQAPCLLNAPVGVPAADVAEAAYGIFYDDLNLARPGLPGLNLGNATWPNGAANMLVRALGSDPNLCAWGGIAPCCYAGDPLEPPVTPTPDLYCIQCIDPGDVTITYTTLTTTTDTTTTTTDTTTSSSSSSSTSSSSTSSTSSSTSSSSTTSTAPTFCACTYSSFYDCDADTWSDPTGSCAQSETDTSQAWALNPSTPCSASTIVVTPGTCTPPCITCAGSQGPVTVSGVPLIFSYVNGTYTYLNFNTDGDTCWWTFRRVTGVIGHDPVDLTITWNYAFQGKMTVNILGLCNFEYSAPEIICSGGAMSGSVTLDSPCSVGTSVTVTF